MNVVIESVPTKPSKYPNWGTFQVGDVVYPSYKPQQAGVIFKIVPTTKPFEKGVHYRDLKGREWAANALHLSSYEELTETTERKAANHRKTLDALKARGI